MAALEAMAASLAARAAARERLPIPVPANHPEGDSRAA